MDMIGYDSYFNHDRSTAGSVEVVPQAMINDMVYPCDTCPLADSCATKFTECSAFRKWSKDGRYAQKDVARFIRLMK
jgi:hypothetical protein